LLGALRVWFGEGERHLCECCLDVALERAARDAKALGGLGLGQPLDDMQQQRFAQMRRQGGERGFCRCCLLGGDQVGFLVVMRVVRASTPVSAEVGSAGRPVKLPY